MGDYIVGNEYAGLIYGGGGLIFREGLIFGSFQYVVTV
jgi:hypothetical protein